MQSGCRSKSGRFVKKSVKDKYDKAVAIKKASEKVGDPSSLRCICNGRRIVEIAHIAEELWCLSCNIPLSLRDIFEEQRKGLIFFFKVRCRSCLALKVITTGKRSNVNEGNASDTNLKASVGMVDAGIGPCQWNSLLSALNIPVPSERMWKRHERTAGPMLESVAQESCNDAVALERSLTESSPISLVHSPTETINVVTSTPVVKIAASYDMGWQKRGNGRSYDSLTGHASLIGLRSKKILQYGVMSKICKRCATGQHKADHDCRKNFSGSAKAMESNLAVELASAVSLKEADVEVGVIIGDDDSATLSALKKGCNSGIEKWSDLNHAKKGFVSMLYGMQKSHKELNSVVIAYLRRCFSFALEQNRNDIDGTKKAILNIVNHVYDEPDSCGSWCQFIFNKESYSHKGLPGGKGLKGENLRRSLESVVNKFALIAHKLAPCAFGQQNESFNSMVAAQAPKMRHYGGSESLAFRVAAAVSKKNLGCMYLVNVNKKLCLSPGSHGEKYRSKIQIRRMQSSVRKAKLCVKRRRLFLKMQRSQKCRVTENKEGLSYNSNIARIPSFSLSSNQPVASHSKVVYFDIETTGLGKYDEICQLAAKCENETFGMYVMPNRKMTTQAAVVTGISIVGGRMFLNKIPVKSYPLKIAMENFINFLRALEGPVVLLGHNLLRFDVRFLIRDIQKLGLLDEFKVCAGFGDTLPLFKKCVPGLKSYKQASLVSHFFDMGSENAHNAEADVEMLSRLITKLNISNDQVLKSATSFCDYINKEVIKEKVLAAKQSLEILKGGVLSSAIIGKIAKLWISYEELSKIYRESGEDGLTLLFCENVNGKPRITKNKMILTKVINYFNSR